MTKVKRPIETNDIDVEFMREYDDMCKLMEYRQIHDFMKPGDIYKVPWRVIPP